MNLDTIRVYAIAKLAWIKKQQQKFRDQERESPREYLDRESHYLWGKRYLLKIIEADASPLVTIEHNSLVLRTRPATGEAKKQAIIDEWYRGQVKEAALPLIAKWEPIIDVKMQRLFVRRMRTKWGSSHPTNRSIRLNTELAKKPSECLEYVVVHELAHFIAPSHNARFVSLMDQYLPHWRLLKEQLNRLPVRHEQWPS
jgi:predicted metal-dependent hydrolase